MFSRKKDKTSKHSSQEAAKFAAKKGGSGIPSIISSDLHVLGTIVSEGMVDIDGVIEGNVKCHTATIRNHGHIKGDVIAETVHVYGKIQGLIKARNVHFFSGCRAEGVIIHESITIEDGAFVDGRFKRTENLDLSEEADQATQQKLFSPHAQEGESSDNEAVALSDEEQEGEIEEGKRSSKKKKQESVLDNLRLISDSPS